MHIVILDEVAISDSQKNRLRALGTVTEYANNPVSVEETLVRLKDADVAVLGWTQLNASTISKLPKLKMISVWATGYNYIDVEAASRQGITVTNVPGYAGTAVAELVISLMLALCRHIIPADRSVREGSYSWQGFKGIELRGKIIGVIGVGNIGSPLIRLAKGFGMKVLALARDTSSRRADQLEVDFVSLPVLLKESDFVTVQVPLTKETEGMLGEKELAMMKPSAYLVSVSHEAVINSAAIIKALKNGHIAGAAQVDEVGSPNPALAALPNLILTPHIGFFTSEALGRKGDTCVANVENFISGDPTNVVSN